MRKYKKENHKGHKGKNLFKKIIHGYEGRKDHHKGERKHDSEIIKTLHWTLPLDKGYQGFIIDKKYHKGYKV